MPADPTRSSTPESGASVKPRRRIAPYVLALIAVILVAVTGWYVMAPHAPDAPTTSARARGGGDGFGGGGGRRGGADPRTVMPVTVQPARTMDFVVYQNALGNVTARNTVTVRPRVDGQLARVLFREGQLVKAGDLLAEIDPRPFEVQLMQASGQMARDQAQLANARIDLERYQTLLKQDSIARQQVDTQAALVRQYEGTVEADRGLVENAKLQLSYTKIVAPSGGRLGLRQVDPGNMVRQADTGGIVIITQIQPIGVIYSIPEDRLAAVMRRMQAGETLSVDAYDRDGKVKLGTGKLITIDNQIDPTTGTIKLKAEFANENGALFPNQFVNVRMQLETLANATAVPTSAIQRGTNGIFVYRVNDDATVSVQSVQLGPAQGETTVIDKGLAPGERVVTDGADKLRDGAKIEAMAPGAAASAQPGQRPGGGGPGRRNRMDNGAAAGDKRGAGERGGTGSDGSAASAK